MMASNATVESPPVVDYTTVTKREIRVTWRFILRTYFDHLQFVDPSYLRKHSIPYWQSTMVQTPHQIYEKLDCLFLLIG
jgi:hypothetical protein